MNESSVTGRKWILKKFDLNDANFIKDKLEKKDIFIIGTLLYVISDLIIFYLIGYNNFWILVFFASFGFIGF